MSQSAIKAAVRTRDGFRCVDCGMTNDESIALTEIQLDVHRLVPGSDYSVDGCVTLCRSCHGKKPRALEDLWGADPDEVGVLVLFWYTALPADRIKYLAMKNIADARGINLVDAFEEAVNRYIGDASPDYCI